MHGEDLFGNNLLCTSIEFVFEKKGFKRVSHTNDIPFGRIVFNPDLYK